MFHNVIAASRLVAYSFPYGMSERIRLLRDSPGITQSQLSEMIGVDLSSISRWERDKIGVSKKKLPKLANALGTSMSYLLGETDDPKPLRQQGVSPEETQRYIAAVITQMPWYEHEKQHLNSDGSEPVLKPASGGKLSE